MDFSAGNHGPVSRATVVLCMVLWLFCQCCEDVNGLDDTDTERESKRTSQPHHAKAGTINFPKDIIVIGGGIAGLAAARTLTKDRTNFTVKIFEAQKDRYGGRMWTDKLKNMKARGIEVDLGAIALNIQAKNNPLLEFVEDFELQTAFVDNPQFIIPWKRMAYDGNALSTIKKEALQILGLALNESKSLSLETSVKDAVDVVLKNKGVSRESSPAEEMVKCLPSYILGDYSTHDYRPEWRDTGYDQVLLDGMGEIADRLLSGSTEELPLHLHLGKAVRQILVDDEKRKVIVRTTDGLQTLVDFVVIAVPFGVIAARDVIFEPILPKQYQQAFEDLGNAAGNKVIVEFEHTFWPEEFGFFIRAVDSEGERGHLQNWVNIQRLLKKKPVLASSLIGAPAISFEKLTDKEAKQAVLRALTDMFGKEAVKKGGKIVRLERSRWMSDSYFKGSGTYPKVGSRPGSWDVLSEPLCPYLYFAGEHTSSESPGTVHGAYNSGVRVGKQILSGLCNARMEQERKKRLEKAKNKTNGQDDDEKDEL